MAITKYGVNATKQLSDTIKSLCGVGEQNGNVKVIYDTYELTADLTGGTDNIAMGGLIPSGALVLDASLFFDDLDASGGTLDLGWAASAELSGGSAVEAVDADGFLATVDVTSAGSVGMLEDQPTRPGLYKRFSAAVQPVVAVNGDTDATSGTITMVITYVID